MKLLNFKFLLLSITWICLLTFSSTSLYAQEEEMAFHDLEPEEDAYQDAYFAAIRYRTIGNYNLAIHKLDEAIAASGSQKDMIAAANFEKAKNQYFLKEFGESISLFEELKSQVEEREALEWIYKIYFEQKDYQNAAKTIQDLLTYSEVYLPHFLDLYANKLRKPEEGIKVLEKVYKNNTKTRQLSYYKDMLAKAEERLEELKSRSNRNNSVQVAPKQSTSQAQSKEEKYAYYQEHLTISLDKYSFVLEALAFYSEHAYFKEQEAAAKKAMDFYPMQAKLYWYLAEAYFNNNKSDKALKLLEEGKDYIIDDAVLEKQFDSLIKKIKN